MARMYYTTSKLGKTRSLTPEGYLLCKDVAIARTGALIYGPEEVPVEVGADGLIHISRGPDELFSEKTIASGEGKPIVNEHPRGPDGEPLFVEPENYKALGCGTMLNLRRGEGAEDDLLIADLLVTDAEAIKAILEEDKTELSLGYESDYRQNAPGVGEQFDITINHVALVYDGRCGARCAIGDSMHQSIEGDTTMFKLKQLQARLQQALRAKNFDEASEVAKELENLTPTKDEDPAEVAAGKNGDIHIHLNSNEAGSAGQGASVDEEPGAATPDIAALSEKLEALIAQNQKEHEEFRARLDAIEKGEEGEVADELPPEAMAELPDDKKEELKTKTGDAAVFADTFKSTVALAEILVPGIRVPSFDAKAKPGAAYKAICGLRKQAVELAWNSAASRAIVEQVHGKPVLDTSGMTVDSMRTLFVASANAQRAANNAALQVARTHDNASGHQEAKKGISSLQDLNAKNRAKYGR